MLALGAWAVLRLRRSTKDLIAATPLLALLAFTLLNALAICDRRVDRGVNQALVSRYCSLTALGLVALYALLTRFALTERRPAPLLAWGAMAAFLVSGAITNYVSWAEDPRWWHGYDVGEHVIRYADVVSDDALSTMARSPDLVRERVPFLRAHGYSLFHRTIPMGVPAKYTGDSRGCVIETVNGRTGSVIDVSRRGDRSGLRVVGWAVDLATGHEPTRLFVSIDARIDVPAVPGGDRPDVARLLKKPSYGTAGFIGYVRTSVLTVGEHDLELKIVSQDDKSYWTCGNSRLLVAE
jgi:hypothetical protein